MMDFLKAFPFMSVEQYLWQYTCPQIEIMRADNTHIRHLSEKQIKMRKAVHIGGEYGYDTGSMTTDLGTPVFG